MKYCLAILITCLLAYSAFTESKVTLAWNASPSTNVIVNYKVYYGPASATYTNVVSAGTNLTVAISHMVDYAMYYFAATAIDADGMESDFSNEISCSPHPPVKVNLVLNSGPACINVQSAPDACVKIWVKNNLNAPVWEVLMEETNADHNGVISFVDYESINHPERYYKVTARES